MNRWFMVSTLFSPTEGREGEVLGRKEKSRGCLRLRNGKTKIAGEKFDQLKLIVKKIRGLHRDISKGV